MGGAIHLPNFGTKHTTMLVVNHTCLLASLFEVLNRFGHCSWLEGSSLCWMPKLVRPTLDAAVASVQHPACAAEHIGCTFTFLVHHIT